MKRFMEWYWGTPFTLIKLISTGVFGGLMMGAYLLIPRNIITQIINWFIAIQDHLLNSIGFVIVSLGVGFIVLLVASFLYYACMYAGESNKTIDEDSHYPY